jgi:hypothetical protein
MKTPEYSGLHRLMAQKVSAVLLLQIACVCCFVGRAWQHIVFDAPFRALLWSETTMTGFIEAVFGIDWVTYSQHSDRYITMIVTAVGFFYALCAVAVWFVDGKRRWASALMAAASVSLMFLSYLYYRDNKYKFNELIEYSLQWATPLALLIAVHFPHEKAKLILFSKLAILGTFLGHGHFAVGFYGEPPASFVRLSMRALGIGAPQAVSFLWVVGVLDIIICFLVFLPRRIALHALVYAAAWGAITALARPYAYVPVGSDLRDASFWIAEAVYRMPNALVPLATFVLVYFYRRAPAPCVSPSRGSATASLSP